MPPVPIYYEDQETWGVDEFYALYRYFDRLAQYVGPTARQLAEPEHRASRMQARRTGRRDDEISSLELDRMSLETCFLLKHVLITQGRFGSALERFENLRGLADVAPLGRTLQLSHEPILVSQYLTSVGILL